MTNKELAKYNLSLAKELVAKDKLATAGIVDVLKTIESQLKGAINLMKISKLLSLGVVSVKSKVLMYLMEKGLKVIAEIQKAVERGHL